MLDRSGKKIILLSPLLLAIFWQHACQVLLTNLTKQKITGHARNAIVLNGKGWAVESRKFLQLGSEYLLVRV